jgi:hypothetical protein
VTSAYFAYTLSHYQPSPIVNAAAHFRLTTEISPKSCNKRGESTTIISEMHRPDKSEIDWTGVQPDPSPIRPLDAVTFVERLRQLTDRAAALTLMRKAFHDQHFNDEQISRDSEPSARQSR